MNFSKSSKIRNIQSFLLILCILISCSDKNGSTAKQKQEDILQNALSYLSDIPEVAWYEIDGNTIYVGFKSLPDDWKIIINAAALNGNRAINFGCHVWAVEADKKGWRPGEGFCYGETTARYGKIE